MSDILDVMYRLRDMAGIAAGDLRAAITEAQTVLDKLDKFADDAEQGAELLAASDLHPNACATIPRAAGLVRVGTLSPAQLADLDPHDKQAREAAEQ